MQILLDLDGVVVNFADAAIRLCGHDPAEVWPRLAPGMESWNFFKAWGMSASDFYRTIDAAGPEFWAGLDPYPGGLELYEFCKSLAPTVFLTAPTLSPHSAAGKVAWMQKHFGPSFADFMIGRHKHLMARTDALLVDDNDENAAKFTGHGGRVVLVPRQWNSAHVERCDHFELIHAEIARWVRVEKGVA